MAMERDFDEYIGKIIKSCQCIEHDIKLIFAGMLKGDFNRNYKYIEKKSLGKALDELQKLDNSDKKPYFSKSDYKLLREITQIRNYWAHQGYVDWVYTNAKTSFSNAWGHLINDYNRIEPLGKETERIRLQFFGYETDNDEDEE